MTPSAVSADLLLLRSAAAPTAAAGAVSGLRVLGAVVVAVVLALVVATVVGVVVRAAGRHSEAASHLSRRARRPLRVVLVVVAVWLAVRLSVPGGEDGAGWRPALEHLLLVLTIVAVTWLIGSLAFVAEDAALRRFRTDVPDNRHARRVRTQIMVLRRLTVVVLSICAIAGVLLTFEGARAAGAGILASAGLLSVVAGLAAQTSLANLFAGLQIAFTDAIRVDDVVVVEEEWGRIEEITMTYVVVHLWDDRRLILPSTYFTTTPFENWTRRAAELLGTVELDLDWRVPVPAMRAELTRVLRATPLWDERVGVLQVTEATGGLVRVRALASAADAPTLFDLRCHVREALVAWLQREHPDALPTQRWEESPPVAAGRDAGTAGAAADGAPDLATEPVTGTDGPAADDGTRGSGGATAITADPRPGALTRPTVHRRPVARAQEETMRISTGDDAHLFTGSLRAVERSRPFAGPSPDVIAERERTAETAAERDRTAGTATRRGPDGPRTASTAEAAPTADGSQDRTQTLPPAS